MGRLTTHVLDLSAGRPAQGVKIELDRIGAQPQRVAEAETNSDGRVDKLLLEGPSFIPGFYDLRFHAGDYFRRCGLVLPDPPFLDVIVIRFGLSGAEHHHVPLLLSPYGYSTYRGS